MTRAVLYLRLSALGEDSTAIARQERDLRALAEREGWEIASVLTDDGISGRKARANAAEALRMLRDDEAQVLAVWKLDRWTRQGLGAIGALADALDARPEALFVALQDGIRSDQASWRLIAAVLSEVARTEAENTATRARSAIAYRKTVADRFTGGPTVPFGYTSQPAEDGPGRVLAVAPAEAAIIREVAARLLDGETLSRVARDLTAREIPTSKSPFRKARYRGTPDPTADRGRWTVSTVKALWTSDSFLGRVRHGGDLVRDEDGLPRTVWPPILDLATVELIRERLGTRDPSRAPRRRAARLLSGFVYCDLCDAKLYVTSSNGRAQYACSSSWNGGDCPSPKVDAANLEAHVAEVFLARNGERPELLLTERVSNPETTAALSEIEAELRATSSALMDDDADTVALVQRVERLKTRRSELRALPASVEKFWTPTGRTIGQAWAASSTDEERRIILERTDLSHVTLRPGRRVSPIDPERVRFFFVPDEDQLLADYA